MLWVRARSAQPRASTCTMGLITLMVCMTLSSPVAAAATTAAAATSEDVHAADQTTNTIAERRSIVQIFPESHGVAQNKKLYLPDKWVLPAASPMRNENDAQMQQAARELKYKGGSSDVGRSSESDDSSKSKSDSSKKSTTSTSKRSSKSSKSGSDDSDSKSRYSGSKSSNKSKRSSKSSKSGSDDSDSKSRHSGSKSSNKSKRSSKSSKSGSDDSDSKSRYSGSKSSNKSKRSSKSSKSGSGDSDSKSRHSGAKSSNKSKRSSKSSKSGSDDSDSKSRHSGAKSSNKSKRSSKSSKSGSDDSDSKSRHSGSKSSNRSKRSSKSSKSRESSRKSSKGASSSSGSSDDSDSDDSKSKSSKSSTSKSRKSSKKGSSGSSDDSDSKSGKSSKSSTSDKSSKGGSSGSSGKKKRKSSKVKSKDSDSDDDKKKKKTSGSGTGGKKKSGTGGKKRDDKKKGGDTGDSDDKDKDKDKKSSDDKDKKSSDDSKNNVKDKDGITGESFDDDGGLRITCDDFSTSSASAYGEIKIHYSYLFYDDARDLLDLEEDMLRHVAGEILADCRGSDPYRSLRQRSLSSNGVYGLNSSPPDEIVGDCDSSDSKECHLVDGVMTAYISEESIKSEVSCDIIEVIQSYMDNYSSEATFVKSDSCQKASSTSTVQPRGAPTAVIAAASVGALVAAILALLACKQVTKRSRHGEEEHGPHGANDKLADQSFDTHSIGDNSTLEGSTLRGGSVDGAARTLEPIAETNFCPSSGPFDECMGDIKSTIKALSRPSSPIIEVPGEGNEEPNDEEAQKRCCGSDCVGDIKENIVAATACCGAACVANDMQENFTAVTDHVGETITVAEDNVKGDIASLEVNTTQNVKVLGEDMTNDMAGMAQAVAAAAGVGVVAAATEEDEDGLDKEASPSSFKEKSVEDKEAHQANSLETIDAVLKSAKWVGVSSGVAQGEGTDADSVEQYKKKDCLSKCCIDSDDLGEISDKIVVVGNLTHEDEVMKVEAFDKETKKETIVEEAAP